MINSAAVFTIGAFLKSKNWEILDSIKEGAGCLSITYGEREVDSWVSNIGHLKEIFESSRISREAVIAFETYCPYTGRIDCLLAGSDNEGRKHIDIIELKQWTVNMEVIPNRGIYNRNQVRVYSGGTLIHTHPSAQAFEYKMSFLSYLPIFENDNIDLNSYAYCYGYSQIQDANNVLLNGEYNDCLSKCALYTMDSREKLVSLLETHFSDGSGDEVYNELSKCNVTQTRILMDAVVDIIKGNSEFTLHEKQIDAADMILEAILDAEKNPEKKHAIVVKGGPGTGKTLIALNVLSKLNGMMKKGYYVTRSKALRNTLCEKLKVKNVGRKFTICGLHASKAIMDTFAFYPKGNKERVFCKKRNGYSENQLDFLLVDEAHRIERSMNNMSGVATYLSQLTSLLYCSKVCVFFIDDKQSICGKEIGNSEVIKNVVMNYASVIERERKDSEEEIEKLSVTYNKRKAYEDKIGTLFAEYGTFEDLHIVQELKEGHSAEGKFEEYCQETCKINNKLTNKKEVYEDEIKPRLTEFEYKELELITQFRCNGSNNYLDWIDAILYPTDKNNANTVKKGDDYIFEVIDKETPEASLDELYSKIIELNSTYCEEKKENYLARISAGYCWKWNHNLISEGPDRGDLPKDVRIGNWSMPWETYDTRPYDCMINGESRTEYYASSSDTWASEDGGVHQLGCVNSAQGFEFDFAGVILGPDIYFDSKNNAIKTRGKFKIDALDPKGKLVQIDGENHNCKNVEDCDIYIRNIYRVLLTRGRKGCFIYCCDKELQEYFKKISK